MVDKKNVPDQPTKNDLKACNNIRKTSKSQRDDYTVECVLDYPHFKKYYKLIEIDLSKQQKLDVIQKQYNKLILLGM